MSKVRSVENLLKSPSFSIVDDHTGEVVARNLQHINTSVGAQEKVKGEFIRMFQASWREFCKLPLTAVELRVFNYVCSWADYTNEIKCNQAYIARELNMTKAQVCNAYKVLREIGLIYRIENDGVYQRYYVSEDVAWKGSEKQLKSARSKRQQRSKPELVSSIFKPLLKKNAQT